MLDGVQERAAVLCSRPASRIGGFSGAILLGGYDWPPDNPALGFYFVKFKMRREKMPSYIMMMMMMMMGLHA